MTEKPTIISMTLRRRMALAEAGLLHVSGALPLELAQTVTAEIHKHAIQAGRILDRLAPPEKQIWTNQGYQYTAANGVTYPSIRAAARALGISENGLRGRIAKGTD